MIKVWMYVLLLHSQNLDLWIMTSFSSMIERKFIEYTIIDKESIYLEFSKTAKFTIWFSDCGKNSNYPMLCAPHSVPQTFLGFTPLLVDGRWQFAGWGFLWSKQRHRQPQQKCVFRSLSSMTNSIFVCLPEEKFCSLQWKCLD